MKTWLTRISALALLAALSSPVIADEDPLSWALSLYRHKEITPVTDSVYNKECGACHMAYQPGLLPAGSWRRLLEAKALEDHFGENAELDGPTREHVLQIALSQSADTSYSKRSRKIMASLQTGETPLRITETRYFKQKHREIPQRLIEGDQVKSLSFCDACHQQAVAGNYDDDTVNIPGHGNWTW